MKIYLIAYDLIGPETKPDYIRLIREIKSFESWAKPLESAWLVKTYSTRSEIYDRLSPYLDPNDKILIISVNDDWITKNLSDAVINWMRSEF